ncbi:carboxy terminal-processing peptidase [Spongiibacter sp. KMU-166]|uniref:Carboxy terminal-processing peptidase n=1 Tax=Spongiibacter thalassae TaxID=2721624 RepID=A0ABX1GE92_9GAMM|nr:carboxy terminal-processing peptidase [Spongiibacter thalassae]NKI17507.1 carboxy terminal-processing peptidase [Spongiibacter thalassae]
MHFLTKISRSRRAALLACLLSVLTLSAPSALALAEVGAAKEHTVAIRDMLRQLNSRHYVKLTLDDATSERLLMAYLDDLDPNRQIFLQSDIDEFMKSRHSLDDELKKSRLDTGFSIFNRYRLRITERFENTIKNLNKRVAAMDFSKDEEILLDRSEMPWPRNKAEADEIWRKQLKNRVLGLRLAGKEDKDIVELLEKRFKNQLKRMTQLEAEDAFQMYANALASLYDPHTDYFSPRLSENFQINMSLKLEGIGAVLQMEDDYTKIVRLVPGGPAAKQGELQPADKIVGVAQGKDGEMQDVIGWRLDDVVDLIRGPSGSTVRLEVIPAIAPSDEERKLVVIERNEVKLEEQSAKGELIEITEADGATRKIGVISIPTFYLDFEAFRMGDPDYRSTTRDTVRIMGELLSEGAEGIVIDLRDNGGGSLAEANSLVGLFIEAGPTVQIKHSNSRVIYEGKRRRSPYYTGPLAVLINRMSASASEIFAGAIQDYQRGIVIGTQSFGKGTVQSVNTLGHGQLKLTESKFYRISGDSTQNRGVIPDIAFPPLYDKDTIGESILDNAMEWDSIPRARHNYYFDLRASFNTLQQKHEKRVAKDPDFRFLKEQLSAIEKYRDRKTLSLNIDKRKKERDEQKALQLAMENRRRVAKGEPPLDVLEEDKELDVAQDLPLTPEHSDAEGDEDKKDKKPDPLLIEAGHILVDAMPYFQPDRLAVGRP